MKTSAFLIIAALACASCGKSPEAVKPAVSEAPKAATVSETRLDAAISDALTPPPPAPATSDELADEAKAILAQYPGKTAADLLNVPEVNAPLRNLLGKLAQDKPLQARINNSVDLAAQIKGLDGAARLDLDIKGYDQARTARMLQAVLSEDPKQLVSFLVGEIGEATPDISYGGLDRAPNGVSIVPAPAAAPTPPKTEQPD
ncbi:hypothetical protein [Prosthecobacter sp.]|uniref:hypothetical protein n=1 Tax=Prosthecobacter sp. TaxID=1965333 RepID=UPI001D571724|nr:hypothetical protein [Prosthecobacter sp.]MCB1278809.1 hypothetical protein [Prosthecobacter sp.]